MKGFLEWVEGNGFVWVLFYVSVILSFALILVVVLFYTGGLGFFFIPPILYAYYHFFVKGKDK